MSTGTRKSELERIALLEALFGGLPRGEGIHLGIGDDAAVIDAIASDQKLVWTIDAQVEGTHFKLDWLDWADVGYRSFMAAVSDIAAMGARPIGALSALALTDRVDDAAFEALVKGQGEAALQTNCPIIGGNLARSANETSITTTVLGRAARPLTRFGAKPGDGIYLCGDVGLAAAGLSLLMAGKNNVQNTHIDSCIQAWRRPRALLEVMTIAEKVTSAIDVSDGLVRDASHVAKASNVSLIFDEAMLRAHGKPALSEVAVMLERDPIDLMLYGGEDYALLLTCPTIIQPKEFFPQIGSVVEPFADSDAVLLQRMDGSRIALDPTRGFDHWTRVEQAERSEAQ